MLISNVISMGQYQGNTFAAAMVVMAVVVMEVVVVALLLLLLLYPSVGLSIIACPIRYIKSVSQSAPLQSAEIVLAIRASCSACCLPLSRKTDTDQIPTSLLPLSIKLQRYNSGCRRSVYH